MHIRITPATYADLYALAGARDESKRVLNQYSEWHANTRHSSQFNHLVGLLGEYAAAMVLGTTVDREVYNLVGDGGLGDLRLRYGGARVEVKTRRCRGWAFALSSTDPRRMLAAYAVLCWPGVPCPDAFNDEGAMTAYALGSRDGLWVDVVGYLSRADLFRLAYKQDFGHGDRTVVDPECFKPLSSCHGPVAAARLLQEAY